MVPVYLLAFAVTLITGGRLGDIFGRRRLFLIGMAGFTIASSVCGAAPTAAVLVVARIFQGMFSGLMYPQALSVLQVAFKPAERGKIFGIFGAVIGLATVGLGLLVYPLVEGRQQGWPAWLVILLALSAALATFALLATVSTEVEIDRSLWGVSWVKMGARLKNQVAIRAHFNRA